MLANEQQNLPPIFSSGTPLPPPLRPPDPEDLPPSPVNPLDLPASTANLMALCPTCRFHPCLPYGAAHLNHHLKTEHDFATSSSPPPPEHTPDDPVVAAEVAAVAHSIGVCSGALPLKNLQTHTVYHALNYSGAKAARYMRDKYGADLGKVRSHLSKSTSSFLPSLSRAAAAQGHRLLQRHRQVPPAGCRRRLQVCSHGWAGVGPPAVQLGWLELPHGPRVPPGRASGVQRPEQQRWRRRVSARGRAAGTASPPSHPILLGTWRGSATTSG